MTCQRCQKEIIFDNDLEGQPICPHCGYLVGSYPAPIYDDPKIND